jgi:CheY-like chemotaxis protein
MAIRIILIFIKPYFTYKTVPLNPSMQKSTITKIPSKFIMFGEDDLDEEDFLKEIFSSLDPSFSLLFVDNGRKLIADLEQMPHNQLPCLLVLDYNMPELNGAEILKVLKQTSRYDAIPKIVWSTSGSEVYKKLCFESGANDYVIKPSNIKELEGIARHLLSFAKPALL